MKIEKTSELGFCFGVRRAISILEKVARERGGVETLGAIVHNQQVLDKLSEIGVRVAGSIDDIRGSSVVTSAHGVSPELQAELQARRIDIIDTTCPFVRRAQRAARKLARAGFSVIVYGDAEHPEVKGILGWAGGKGLATLDEEFVSRLEPLPRRLGILSQTTRIPAHFTRFAGRLIEAAFTRDSEVRVIDTICHDIRRRQAAAVDLARGVDLMVIIGGRDSANTHRLAELCSAVTPTYLVETADEIEPSWLQDKHHIGVTAGASTAGPTINEVLTRLETLALEQH